MRTRKGRARTAGSCGFWWAAASCAADGCVGCSWLVSCASGANERMRMRTKRKGVARTAGCCGFW
jgi:hypothetical protein